MKVILKKLNSILIWNLIIILQYLKVQELIFVSHKLKLKILNQLKLKMKKNWKSFEPTQLCLSDNGITLRDYFSYMEEVKSEENGIFIKGMYLYQ